MNLRFFALILACLAVPVAAAAVFVAPDGDDGNSGTRDNPVATPARARDLARKAGVKRIVLRGGLYHDVGLELGPADSGLTIEAAPGEKPVLHGGVLLGRWEPEGEHFVSTPLPAAAGGAEVRMLEVAGRMAPRARLPAEGTFEHESGFDVRWMSSTGGGWQRKPTPEESTALRYKQGDIGTGLDLRNAEITVFHMWDESCVGLAAHDPAARLLTFSSPAGHPPGAFGVRKFVLWNVREGMTGPGRWFHDRTRDRIVYWPLPGEDLAATKVVAATREWIVRIRGTAAEPVRGVTLRGLALSATTVPLRAAGFAAAAYDGAVSLDHAHGCVLENLVIARVGGHAIQARGGIVNLHVRGNEIADCGAGGIYAGGEAALIENNHVHGIGRAYPSAIGIFRGGRNCIVRHNEVHDTSYTAINYGGERNLIERNLIHDCMKVLHDGAAIYLFAGRDCIVRGNVARDITDTGGYGASSYYLDERSEGCVVEENLSLRVKRPFHNHMARGNTIRRNVALVEGDATITFPRCSEFTFESNVIHATGKIRFENSSAVTSWQGNVLFSGAGRIERVTMDDYKPMAVEPGVPPGSMAADPLFADPPRGDFRYREGSPARSLPPAEPAAAGRRPKHGL